MAIQEPNALPQEFLVYAECNSTAELKKMDAQRGTSSPVPSPVSPISSPSPYLPPQPLEWETTQSCFSQRLCSARIRNPSFSETVLPDTFLKLAYTAFQPNVEVLLDTNHVLKINAELVCDFVFIKQNVEMVDKFHFVTRMKTLHLSDDLKEWYDTNVVTALVAKFDKFMEGDSNKALDKIHYLGINICQYDPLHSGSSYIPLPKDVSDRRAVLNIKNYDNDCFL